MGLLDTLLSGQQNALLGALAKNVNLGEGDVKNVLGQLLPALSKGVKNNISNGGGLDNLLNALNSGNHQQYLDEPDKLTNRSTVSDGNSILGHIFGSKDVSRNVAAHAAEKTGVSSSIIKKMLPLVATLAMGALSKKSLGAGSLGTAQDAKGDSDTLGMLGSFLDTDDDGSITDDLLSLAIKLF